MVDVVISERAAASPVADTDVWLRRLLAIEAAARGGAEVVPAWDAPQAWTMPGQQRVVGRAPDVEIVLVRDESGMPVALRLRRGAPPLFELIWKRGGELVVNATLPEERCAAVRAAVGAAGTPAVTAPPAPPRGRSRSELLSSIAQSASAVGDELDALDRGAGSRERIAAREREVRGAMIELPEGDEAALREMVAAGLARAWSDVARIARDRAATAPDPTALRERARALHVAALGGGPEASAAWSAAAARLRDALEVDPPARPAQRAAAWLQVVHFEAAAGCLAEARRAFEQALATSATIARRALHGSPLHAWRADLAEVAGAIALPRPLAPHADEVAATWLPAVRLSTVAAPSDAGPTSRLGGRPSLPASIAWPAGTDGVPMRFLLQVDLGLIPPQPPLPRRGLLLVFLADGHGLARAEVRVLHAVDPPAVAPEPRVATRPLATRACALSGSAALEPACPPDARFAALCPALSHDAAAVRALGKAFPIAGTKLGGYAFFNQEDPRAANAARADHVLLLQVDEEPMAELSWGDGGVGHVFAPAEDLARADFSRAWWSWDCL